MHHRLDSKLKTRHIRETSTGNHNDIDKPSNSKKAAGAKIQNTRTDFAHIKAVDSKNADKKAKHKSEPTAVLWARLRILVAINRLCIISGGHIGLLGLGLDLGLRQRRAAPGTKSCPHWVLSTTSRASHKDSSFLYTVLYIVYVFPYHLSIKTMRLNR